MGEDRLQQDAEQPLQEPAEGARPEDRDRLDAPVPSVPPLDEPAEGAEEDAARGR